MSVTFVHLSEIFGKTSSDIETGDAQRVPEYPVKLAGGTSPRIQRLA